MARAKELLQIYKYLFMNFIFYRSMFIKDIISILYEFFILI